MVDASIWATSPLGVAVRYVLFLFFSPVALWDSKAPHRSTSERVSCCLETSPPSWLPPQHGSQSLTLLSLFLSFIFCPTYFWREWAAFLHAWCPPPASRSCFVEVAQHSNDLLMSCGGETGLPILFLHHLRTTGQWYFFLNPYVLKVCIYLYHTQTTICFLTNFLGDLFFFMFIYFFLIYHWNILFQ